MKKLKAWYKRGRLNPSKTLYIDGFSFFVVYVVYQSEGWTDYHSPGARDWKGVACDMRVVVVVVVFRGAEVWLGFSYTVALIELVYQW